MEFQFTSKAKRFTFILMAVGLVALIGGFLTDHSEHHQQWWSNLLVNGFFFFTIAVAALFFYALQYAAEVAWSAQLQRVFQAIFSFVPVGIVIMLIILIAGKMHWHHIYHWMDETLYDISSANYDEIIANKGAYFATWFFFLRSIVYMATFYIFARLFRKWSLLQDEIGGVDLHKKVFRRSAVFLVFFAVFSSTMAWDYIMSIDTHWFSTLFGWYMFSGMWVSFMIFATIMVIWLKGHGYLPQVNDSHIHDLGKWMFAISMLWAYLWFSQFMLIWYSDIPEETTYFITRFEHYMTPFMLTFFINFAVPFYFLMARDMKRKKGVLVAVGLLIFFFHWMDVYICVIPGTMFSHHHFQAWEFGMFLGFLGLFIFVVLRTLTKAPLLPKNHPLMGESKHHSI